MADELAELIKQSFQADPNLKITTQEETPGMEGMVDFETVKVETENKAEAKPEDKQEKTPAEVKEEVKPEDKKPATPDAAKAATESSLKDDKKEEAVKPKSFDDELSEKTSGKFKSWDEVQKAIEKPEVKFANEKVEKINQYIEQGGTYEDWAATQSIDFKTLTPAEKLAYKMQIDDPEITAEEIELDLKLKYGFDKWKDNVEDYEDGVEPEEVKLQKMRFERESKKAETTLLDYQKKWSVPQPKNNDQIEAQKADQIKRQETWDNEVDETMKAIDKLPLKLSDQETHDFALTTDEQKDLAKLTKQIYTNAGNLFLEFVDKKSPTGFNVKGIAEMIAKAKYFDRAVSIAAQESATKASLEFVKNQKNIDMKPTGKGATPSALTQDEQVAQNIIANG